MQQRTAPKGTCDDRPSEREEAGSRGSFDIFPRHVARFYALEVVTDGRVLSTFTETHWCTFTVP